MNAEKKTWAAPEICGLEISATAGGPFSSKKPDGFIWCGKWWKPKDECDDPSE